MTERDERMRDEGVSRAYRRSANDMPPAALDAAILAAARRAVQEEQANRPMPWWRRSLMPVGMLATLVLTLSLVLVVRQEQGDALPSALPLPAAAPPPVERGAAGAAVPPAESVAEKPEARAMRREAIPDRTKLPQFAPAPATQAAPEEAVASAPMVAAPVAPAGSASVPMAVEAKKAEVMAAPAPARSRASALSQQRDAAVEERSSPEAWLDEIRRLRREGREAEARERLATFRRAYPDYPLPDEFKVP